MCPWSCHSKLPTNHTRTRVVELENLDVQERQIFKALNLNISNWSSNFQIHYVWNLGFMLLLSTPWRVKWNCFPWKWQSLEKSRIWWLPDLKDRGLIFCFCQNRNHSPNYLPTYFVNFFFFCWVITNYTGVNFNFNFIWFYTFTPRDHLGFRAFFFFFFFFFFLFFYFFFFLNFPMLITLE